MSRTRATLSALLTLASAASAATPAEQAARAFGNHCFSPFLTAEKARAAFAGVPARVEFYDLDPFSSAAPSPVTGRAATDGTDRRCEVAFDGDYSADAGAAVIAALDAEGIRQNASVPAGFVATPGTHILAARQLNPRRVAVVHVGTRPGPNGIETFMNVERLRPSAIEQ